MVRPAFLSILTLTISAAPVAAQLTPEQRAIRENNATRHQQVIEEQYQRSTYQANEVARWRFLDRQRVYEDSINRSSMRSGRSSTILWHTLTPQERAQSLGKILLAVTARGVTPRHVNEAEAGPARVPQRTPLRLTLVDPVGGPGVPISVAYRMTDPSGTELANGTEVVTADENGYYRLGLAPLRSGEYHLQITTTPGDPTLGGQHLTELRIIAWE